MGSRTFCQDSFTNKGNIKSDFIGNEQAREHSSLQRGHSGPCLRECTTKFKKELEWKKRVQIHKGAGKKVSTTQKMSVVIVKHKMIINPTTGEK